MISTKVSFLIPVILAVSCSDLSHPVKRELDNEQDQKKINTLYENLSLEDYGSSVSDISGLYADRVSSVGFETGNMDFIREKVFEVWPAPLQSNKTEFLSEINAHIDRYYSESARMKTSGVEVSPMDLLIQSEEADTVFSDIEKQFLRDSQNVFKEKGKDASFYVSELKKLQEDYRSSYDLTDREFVTIVGIAESVSGFISVLDESKGQLSQLFEESKEIGKAGLFSNFVFFQTADEEHYTGADGSFEPDWGAIGESALLNGVEGMLIGVVAMGYAAWAGPVGIAGALGGIYISTAGGAVFGGVNEGLRQWDVHKDWTKNTDRAEGPEN